MVRTLVGVAAGVEVRMVMRLVGVVDGAETRVMMEGLQSEEGVEEVAVGEGAANGFQIDGAVLVELLRLVEDEVEADDERRLLEVVEASEEESEDVEVVCDVGDRLVDVALLSGDVELDSCCLSEVVDVASSCLDFG